MQTQPLTQSVVRTLAVTRFGLPSISATDVSPCACAPAPDLKIALPSRVRGVDPLCVSHSPCPKEDAFDTTCPSSRSMQCSHTTFLFPRDTCCHKERQHATLWAFRFVESRVFSVTENPRVLTP